jgi:hypothetical protein
VTQPGSWDLADADPVAAVVWWLANHTRLNELLRETPTGDGPVVGSRNAPPYPRLRVLDIDAGDLGTFNGLVTARFMIEALGDTDGTPGKFRLRRIAVAAAEALNEITEQESVQHCVFSLFTAGGPNWAPLPPNDQPRYLFPCTTRSRPAWDYGN